MKKLYILLLVSLIVVSCNNQKGSKIVIKGELTNATGSKLYLKELTVKGDGHTDTLELSESGKFKFAKYVKFPTFYSLWVDSGKPVTLVALPKEKIKIEGVADSLSQTYSVAGSEESSRAQVLSRMLDYTIGKLDSLNRVYRMFVETNNPNISQIEQTLTNNYNNFVDEHRTFTLAFIEKDINSFTNIMALYQQINTNTFVLYKPEDLALFDKVYAALRKKYPNSPYIQTLNDNITRMKGEEQNQKVKEMIANLGAKAPEIALPSPKGDTIRLSSFQGKYVLVDFWASWCPPCRRDNPDLVAIYKQFRAKGFEIFQVSLDKTRDAWVTAIREDGCIWPNVSDLQYWNSSAAKTYNIDAIPASFLLDKDGTIISRNLRGQELYNRLVQLLGQ